MQNTNKLEVVNKFDKLRWSTCVFFFPMYFENERQQKPTIPDFCCFSINGRNLRHTPPEKPNMSRKKKGGPFPKEMQKIQGINLLRGYTRLRLEGGLLTT